MAQILQPPDPQALLSVVLLIGYKAIIVVAILAVGWVVGRVFGMLVGRTVARIGGDAAFRRTAFGRALIKSGMTASDFSNSLTKWIIYITALLFALDSLGIGFISSGVREFLAYLPMLVGTVILVLIGLIFSDWIGESIKRGFTSEQREAFYLDFIGNFVKIVLYYVIITLALSQLGVDVTILHIFAQALAWAIAIAAGVASGIVIGWFIKDKVKDLFR